MKKSFLIIFLLLILNGNIFSNSSDVTEISLSQSFGVAAGFFSTGFGLSYRYWPEDLGVQFVVTPTKDVDNTVMLSLVLSGIKTVYETEQSRFFMFVAGNTKYTNNYNDVMSQDNYSFSLGAGPGLEVYLFKHVVIDTMFGVKFDFDNGSVKTGLTAETGLYFKF